MKRDRSGFGRTLLDGGHEFAGVFGPGRTRIGWYDFDGQESRPDRSEARAAEIRDDVERWRIMAERGERLTAWRE